MSISDGCPVCGGKTFTTKEVVVDVGAPGEPSHRGRVPLYTGACSECERVRGLIEAALKPFKDRYGTKCEGGWKNGLTCSKQMLKADEEYADYCCDPCLLVAIRERGEQ